MVTEKNINFFKDKTETEIKVANINQECHFNTEIENSFGQILTCTFAYGLVSVTQRTEINMKSKKNDVEKPYLFNTGKQN